MSRYPGPEGRPSWTLIHLIYKLLLELCSGSTPSSLPSRLWNIHGTLLAGQVFCRKANQCSKSVFVATSTINTKLP